MEKCPLPLRRQSKNQIAPMHDGGFVLAELLVVISVIALVSAIAFPVFVRARDAAKKTGCLSNLKQIGTAISLYTTDNDEILPPACTYEPNSKLWTDPGIVGAYVKDDRVFYCPASGNNPGNGLGDYGTNPYIFDSPYEPTDILIPRLSERIGSNSLLFYFQIMSGSDPYFLQSLSLSQIESPSSTLSLVEMGGRGISSYEDPNYGRTITPSFYVGTVGNVNDPADATHLAQNDSERFVFHRHFNNGRKDFDLNAGIGSAEIGTANAINVDGSYKAINKGIKRHGYESPLFYLSQP